ncbi:MULTISPECIES: CHAP domain-containing protein [Paenibacillus]|uniref:CHAP domain-containing protein n=3 Tax=Paenibacillus TaxID=44249 RepID=A0AAP3ZXT3_PAEPO|nr:MULTISPECIES: CHAP domain-containing protein [Paenibacillus]MCP3745419.1 CHAP domain-containing protein [Paenibacillus sp. A3M_27_13]MDH2331051.1 CHAP domain-containing protein [Paenibacillus polymyxa]
MIHESKFKRLESVRSLVHEMLVTTENTSMKQEAWVHLSGVSNFASMLAMRREQDVEIAAIAGVLHGFYFYKTGIKDFPGPNSADAVRPIIRSTQLFTDEEQLVILRSIFYQEDRHQVHGPCEEIIKDAILLQMYLQNTGDNLSKAAIHRLQNVFVELGISVEHVEAGFNVDTETINSNAEDSRLMLADFAEMFAGQNIIGVPEDERYREICKYWPDSDIYKVLEGNWCAAFVYYCCMQVGILLPIRYPNCMYRLAGVGAWLDWAQLPETEFFYHDKQDGFEPARGDIVVYEKLLSDDSHDHIGIVLGCDDNKILVAEGNKDNKNYSSVLYRDRGHCILGYIRIDNGYHFHFSGEYTPIR